MSLRDLRRRAGRFVMAGFVGHSAPDDLRRLIAEFDLAGVILFARNVVQPQQVADLSREVAGLSREWPLWIGVDQEGGRVARLKRPFTEWPAALALGRSGDEGLAARFAQALAAELRAVGITLDFAPVLDVHSNPDNPAIGDRAFSTDPEAVARLGSAVIRGLQQGGVAACGKHFPGHGDTSVDSHEAVPVVEHDVRRLEAVEFVPFRRAIAEGVAALMTAHLKAPALDANRIGTFSPAIVTGRLKQELGFPGVVFSDDLGMKAVSATTPLPDATVAAIRAGCDVALLCNSTVDEQWRAIEALIRAAECGDLPAPRLDDALARQQATKARFARIWDGAPVPIDRVGCEAHLAIAGEMAGWLRR
jgi:beta-N-acetylhexosaminidase